MDRCKNLSKDRPQVQKLRDIGNLLMKLLNMFGKTRLEEASLEELELVLNTIEGNVGGFKRGLKAFQEKAMAIQQRKLKKRLESKRMI